MLPLSPRSLDSNAVLLGLLMGGSKKRGGAEKDAQAGQEVG